MIENPYAPPSAECVAPPQADMFQELKSQSTWRLLGLGIITYGVYYAHYCARQSKVINRYAGTDSIHPGLVLAILVLSYASLGLFFGYMFVDESHPVAIASNVTDKLWLLLVLVWGGSMHGIRLMHWLHSLGTIPGGFMAFGHFCSRRCTSTTR